MQVIKLNLDRAGDSVTGQTVVDPKVRALIRKRELRALGVVSATAHSML